MMALNAIACDVEIFKYLGWYEEVSWHFVLLAFGSLVCWEWPEPVAFVGPLICSNKEIMIHILNILVLHVSWTNLLEQ